VDSAPLGVDGSPVIPQPKIILEGTHLTRKTDTAFALAEHVRVVGHRKRRWHIPLVSSEWETMSDKPPTKARPGRSLIDFTAREEAAALELYQLFVRMFELQRDYYWIVDRFHISTQAYQMMNESRVYEFADLEARLGALDFRLVLLTRRPDTFPDARRHRLTYSENPHRYGDLDKFVEEQELMRALVDRSLLESTEIDVSDGNVRRVANSILDWVERTGAFWPDAKDYASRHDQQLRADADDECR
jgi:hypothetical protein